MYKTGDLVVYGIHGVCRMIYTEERLVDRKRLHYYVLEPVEQSGARYWIPMHNEAAMGKLRPVLSREELEALLRSDEVRQSAWISDENQRKQAYRELINSADRAALIRMVGSLHRHKADLIASGKKFHLCDENFLRSAQKLLSSEFALVLGIEQNEVEAYIQAALGVE